MQKMEKSCKLASYSREPFTQLPKDRTLNSRMHKKPGYLLEKNIKRPFMHSTFRHSALTLSNLAFCVPKTKFYMVEYLKGRIPKSRMIYWPNTKIVSKIRPDPKFENVFKNEFRAYH